MSTRRGRTARPARPSRSFDHLRRVESPYPPLRALSDDEIEHVHERALDVLQEHGMRVLLPEARQLFCAAGAAADPSDERQLRLPKDLVRTAVATAPAVFEIEAPDPARSLRLGCGDDGRRRITFVPAGGPPYCSDLERGRRPGTLADFDDFLRLTQHYDVIHSLGACVEPQDVPLEVRHLVTLRSKLALTDKVPFIDARGRQTVADCFEALRLAHGLTQEEFRVRPRCWTNINTNSPRQLDVPMALGIIDFARAGQPCVMTPFTLAGAMAPITLAGALMLQHAEALAAITLSQLAARGAPVVYGAFTSNVDMRSGAPAFGTPETVKAAIASGQLARHLGVPWRSSGSCSSNCGDAQAGYETMMSMNGALLGGADIIFHTAGWQEGGLCASFEKFVLDVEMLNMWAESFRPINVDETSLAFDSVSTVDPGGHFFGTDHTRERYADEFYEPIVFTRENWGQWTDGGSRTAEQRASEVARTVLREFEPPSVADARVARAEEFLGRRIAEGGVSSD